MKRLVTEFGVECKSYECKGQFQPPNSRVDLVNLLNNASDGVIRVRSRCNKLVYTFQGVECLQELVDALLYAVQEDYKSGIPTYNAACGYPVYSHWMYGKVKRRLYGM